MPFTCIDYSVTGRIAHMTLNRTEKRNALNEVMVQELKEALLSAQSNDEVRVIILGAAGEVFSAGADLQYLKQLQQNSLEENQADSRNLMELFLQIYRHPKVVIAQVEGHAIAGGCGLATVCDICYAVPQAMFGYSEVQIGFIPALVSAFLVRKVGEGRARELLLTGKRISAQEALEMGMINGVVTKTSMTARVEELAYVIAHQTSAESIAQTKKLLSESWGLSLEESLSLAAQRNAEARTTIDCKRGITAFLNKEKIHW